LAYNTLNITWVGLLNFDTFKDPLYKLQRIGLKNYVSETAYSILASRMGMFYEKLIKVLPTLEVQFSSLFVVVQLSPFYCPTSHMIGQGAVNSFQVFVRHSL